MQVHCKSCNMTYDGYAQCCLDMEHQIIPALTPATLHNETHFIEINDTTFEDLLIFYENNPHALRKEHLLQALSRNKDLTLWRWRVSPHRDDLASRLHNLGIGIHDVIPYMKPLHEDYNTASMTAREFYDWDVFFSLFKFNFKERGMYIMLDWMRNKIKIFPTKIGCILTSTIMSISYSNMKLFFDSFHQHEKIECLSYMADNSIDATYFSELCEYDTNVDANEKNKFIQKWFTNIKDICNDNIQNIKNMTRYDWMNVTIHPYIEQEIKLMELKEEIEEFKYVLSRLSDRYSNLIKNKITYL